MSDSDIAEDVDIEELSSGGGKTKRVAAALGLLAVLFVVLKLRGRGSSGGDEETETSGEGADEDDRIDTISTADDSDDLQVQTSTDRGVAGGRFEDLDVVDYLAIFAAALQSARDEYRIRTER